LCLVKQVLKIDLQDTGLCQEKDKPEAEKSEPS